MTSHSHSAPTEQQQPSAPVWQKVLPPHTRGEDWDLSSGRQTEAEGPKQSQLEGHFFKSLPLGIKKRTGQSGRGRSEAEQGMRV